MSDKNPPVLLRSDTRGPRKSIRKTVGSARLTFENITYTVKLKKKETKKILDGISGSIEPGKLTAIMGASGAGKTTLLNILAARAPKTGKYSLEGTMHVNGEAMPPDIYKKLAAYLQQDDVMFPNLTPTEQITYAAQLLLPKEMDDELKRERVAELISELGLTRCADTIVGLTGVIRGVSGGERKRTAIGCELVTDPRILFCDEPTSGLDSQTALSIVQLLAELAHMGNRTVACTIHQPSSEIFDLFDNLMLLSRGRLVYYGPAKSAIEYFRSIGHPCPEYANPGDFIMKLLHEAGKQDDETDPEKKDPKKSTAYFLSQYESSAMQTDWKKTASGALPPIQQQATDIHSLSSTFRQMHILMDRGFTNHRREKRHTLYRFIQYFIGGLIAGLMFLRLDHTQRGIENRAGVIFFINMFSGFMGLQSVMMLFPEERPIFLREYAKGMYSSYAYYFSKILVEIPFDVLFPTILGSVAYFLIGLNPQPDKFFIFLLGNAILANTTVSLGLVVSAAMKDLQQAMVVAPALMMPMIVFGGFFTNVKQIPVYFIWIQYISPFRYGFEALVTNEFTGQTFRCVADELRNGTCPLVHSPEIIKSYSFDLGVWPCLGIGVALMVTLRTLAYFGLLLYAKTTKTVA